MAETVSNTPWSNFKESDYTDEQWLRACLLDRGAEAGTAKQRASLPVREPSGILNRNGVHAAAGALAGARGGLKNLSSEQKSSVKNKLARLYSVLGESPPDSLTHSALDSTGNTTAAIMAIPAPLESIRLVGDEDKHATLLYFGETSTLPEGAKDVLTESVKLACSMLFPFSEVVRDVSRLGSDVPPALVAMLSDRNLTQVRNLFAMNPEVKGYLSNADQFPSFTPHVTLGFPDFADEVILRSLMRGIYRVNFDRLSVWWNDEQIDYDLTQMVEGDSMAMSDAVENFLEHHGVKGQKWGVRRSRDASTGLVARTSSADQISQDRILKKVKIGGVGTLSNKDIQDYTRRLQLQQDLGKALATQSAQEKAKADGFIKTFVKRQGSRQFDRVANKTLDIAVEAALKNAGVKFETKNPALGKGLQDVSRRLKPKKG